jgi:hypothetical protein
LNETIERRSYRMRWIEPLRQARSMGRIGRRAFIIVGFAIALSSLPASALADPAPLFTLSGTCAPDEVFEESGRDTFFYPPLGETHSATVARLRTSGPASLIGSFNLTGLVGPDTVWVDSGMLEAGEIYSGEVGCETVTGYEVAESDVPTAPVSYSGALTPSGDFEYGGSSELLFGSAGGGPNEARIALRSGAISVSAAGVGAKVFSSSGTYYLGDSSGAPGTQSIRVEALEGPQAVWTITIVPIPVKLSAIRFAPKRILAGQNAQLHYTTSGATRITAQIVQGGSGEVVRQLTSDLPVKRGQHVLYWNGASQDGRPLPPGTYIAKLTSDDYNGNTSSGTARLQVARPTLTAEKAKQLARRLWRRKAGKAFVYGRLTRFTCARRLSRVARKCLTSWFLLDYGYKGVARVRLIPGRSSKPSYRLRYRLLQIDEYCQYVLNRSRGRCSRVSHGKLLLH